MSGLLEGKIAVVTGAGHGIGRGHAMELAKHGARVVVNDLGSTVQGEGSGRDADLTVELIKKNGGAAVADYGNVADESDAAAMVERAVSEWGRLDILVNNAGIVRDAAIWNHEADALDPVMAVHVRGTWLTSPGGGSSLAGPGQGRRDPLGTDHQHHLGGRPGRELRPEQLRHRQGGDRGADPDAGPGAAPARCDRERHRTRRCHPPHRHHAQRSERWWSPTRSPRTSHRHGPARSSPVVAWLASDEAQYVTGQVIRAIHDKLHLMGGWYEAASARSGERRWDAMALGDVFAAELFKTQGRGLRTW